MREETDERVYLTPSQAEAMLPAGDSIHTFRQAPGGLIGADWSRAAIIKALKTRGPELSGALATSMNHGIVFFDEHGPVFVATKAPGGARMKGYSDTLGYANVLTDALTQAGLKGDKRAELVAIVAKMAITMARITELEAENLRLLHYVTTAVLDYVPNEQKAVPE